MKEQQRKRTWHLLKEQTTMRFLLEMYLKFIFFVTLYELHHVKKMGEKFHFLFQFCKLEMKVLQLKCIFMIHEFWIEMCPLGTMVKAYYTSNILFRGDRRNEKGTKWREKEQTYAKSTPSAESKSKSEIVPKMQFICHQRTHICTFFFSLWYGMNKTHNCHLRTFIGALIECTR